MDQSRKDFAALDEWHQHKDSRKKRSVIDTYHISNHHSTWVHIIIGNHIDLTIITSINVHETESQNQLSHDA